MTETSWIRRSYEAGVLVVPLDPGARAWLAARRDDLDGITTADVGPAVSDGLEQAVHDTDVVVLLTHDLAALDRETVVRVSDRARLAGSLLGAVILSPDARWREPEADRSARIVRESVDTVVILKDDRLVPGFLQVLRGGGR